ncbi:DNA-binding protein [Streptomyces sp. NPDC004838]
MEASKAKGVREELLSPARVCEEYPIFTPAALADRRWRGDGPDYIKTAPGRSGRVYYRRSAIEKWLDARTVQTGAAA